MGEEAYLAMCDITKEFPGVKALDRVSFWCNPGEIHALVGENGAGKSTLMNMLGGLLVPDAGSIYLDGKEIQIASPQAAYQYGVGFVHQESNLLTNLTVTENIFLAREICGKYRGLDRNEMRTKVIEINQQLGYQLNPDARVGNLKLAERQLTEIARAVMYNPKILIMDEPTAALSEDEVQRLFGIIAKLKENGVCIIYISHRLEEVVAIADKVTVLKDGKNAGNLKKEEITKNKMISMMVGRTLKDIYPDRSDVKKGDVLLNVKNLTVKGKAENINFTVKAGEIVGFGGLEAQGQREVLRAIFGDIPFESGSVTANGIALKSRGILKRIDSGLGYVTYDRRGEGLILHQSIRKNTSLASLKRICSPLRTIIGRKEEQQVKKNINRLQIKASSMEQQVANLSGGNQQKVMLARWLMVTPRVLIVDEPTKGIDVGARMSVYQIIHELTLDGIGIVILTSDMLELIGLSDRILMFYEGKITAEIPREQATEERLMQAASGMMQEGESSDA